MSLTTWTRMAAIGLIAPLLAQGCTGSRAQLPTQHYVATTQSLLPLGELSLSNTRLEFGELEGGMKLKYAGVMPDSAGKELGGASIYRIDNGERYFRQNVGRHAFCAEAPRWVAVNSSAGAPAWSDRIWLGLLTLEEWAEFKPGTDAACLAGDYIRTGG